MDEKKSITIITVTLNRPSLKEACLSVDSQTYTNWHHYVLGDGVLPSEFASPQRSTLGFSTALGATEPGANMLNGTPNPLLRWALNHIRLNDYVCFLDDDNQYLPTFLEKMANALNNNPEVGIVLCGAEDLRYSQQIDGYPEMARCDNSAFMVRREVARKFEFPYASLEKNVVQDYEYIKLCANSSGWIRVPEKLLLFGAGMNPPPKRGKVLFLESWKLGQQASELAYIGKYDDAEKLFYKALDYYAEDAWSWKKLAEMYLIQGKYGKADKAFQQWKRLFDKVDQNHVAAQFAYAQYLKHYGHKYKELMMQSLKKRQDLELREPEAYEHRCYILLSYLFLEDELNARIYLEKCMEINPHRILWAFKDVDWTIQAYKNDILINLSSYIDFFRKIGNDSIC